MNTVRDLLIERNAWNRCRYVRHAPGGHYESYFLRANHPERPLAFWIRYTIFSPKGRAGDAVGELHCIFSRLPPDVARGEAAKTGNCRRRELRLEIQRRARRSGRCVHAV